MQLMENLREKNWAVKVKRMLGGIISKQTEFFPYKTNLVDEKHFLSTARLKIKNKHVSKKFVHLEIYLTKRWHVLARFSAEIVCLIYFQKKVRKPVAWPFFLETFEGVTKECIRVLMHLINVLFSFFKPFFFLGMERYWKLLMQSFPFAPSSLKRLISYLLNSSLYHAYLEIVFSLKTYFFFMKKF